ncbi:MAG: chaperone NapD [Thermodesulfobacteriota bacterium]
MPILSFLVLPQAGEKEQLWAELAAMEYCQVIPAENMEVLVLVTDTPDEKSEKSLQKRLQALPSLQSLSMTFGHNTDQ